MIAVLFWCRRQQVGKNWPHVPAGAGMCMPGLRKCTISPAVLLLRNTNGSTTNRTQGFSDQHKNHQSDNAE